MAASSSHTDAGALSVKTMVLALTPFALGYFLSYLYRTVNAVIGSTLVDELGLTAGGLGLLTSAYFIAFAAAQLPLGFFLDSHGPRRTDAVLLIIAALPGLAAAHSGHLADAGGHDHLELLVGLAIIAALDGAASVRPAE